MKSNIKPVISILIDLLTAALVAVGCMGELLRGGGNILIYYTIESNLFLLIACVIYATFRAVSLFRPTFSVPLWVKYVKYMAVCCTTVTFLVVIFVLLPLYGLTLNSLIMLFLGSSAYLHVICPLLGLLSFVIFDKEPPLRRSAPFIALIPTLLYAIVTIILNVLRLMKGPYPFLFVYEQPVYMSVIWVILIDGGALGIAFAVKALNKSKSKQAIENADKTEKAEENTLIKH